MAAVTRRKLPLPTARTSPPAVRPRLLALLLTTVLLGHWIALGWLREQVPQRSALAAMADPMFTRLLEQATPPTPAAPAAAKAPAPVPPTTMALLPEADAVAVAPTEPPPELPPAPQPAPEPAAPTVTAAAAVSAPLEVEPTPEPADDWPADTRLTYKLTGYHRGEMVGNARVQWQREQSSYQVRVDMRIALLVQVVMTSQGEVTPDGLQPRTYEEQMPGSLRRVEFDGRRVRFADGNLEAQPAALQDTASQFVELSRRFSSGREKLEVGRSVDLWLARPQGMALWTYDVVEEEQLPTPELGLVPAFHLKPRPIANPRGVISAEIWFAPSLQFLPVRVRISLGGGSFVDLLVETIEQAVVVPPTPPPSARGSYPAGPTIGPNALN